ncbi:MAG: hypothetical protein SGARI_006621, partial [Bacillariaceae sp.]
LALSSSVLSLLLLAVKTANADTFRCVDVDITQIQNPDSPARSACCNCVCGSPTCMISNAGGKFCGQPGTVHCMARKGEALAGPTDVDSGRRVVEEEVDIDLLTDEEEGELFDDAFCDSTIQYYLSIEALDLLEGVMALDNDNDNITCAEWTAEEVTVEAEIDLYSVDIIEVVDGNATEAPTGSGAASVIASAAALMAIAGTLAAAL